jgi:hypothetical protein
VPQRAIHAGSITRWDTSSVVAEVWRLFVSRFWRTLIVVLLLLAPLELGVALLDPDLTSVDYGWWVWVGVSAAVTLVAFPWAIGALVHDVAEADGPVTQPYARTWDRLRDLILSALVTTVGIALGIVALVVPGLILFARWALVVPLIVLERLPWRAALGRSNELVRGQTGRVLVVFALLTLIALALAAVPVLVGYFVLEGVLGAWLATLALDTAFIAFYSFAPFVLYRRLAG